MSLAPVIDLLREAIGLDPESLGPTVLPRAVEARMQVLGLTTPATYAARLLGDLQEFQTLIGDLTVSETWFFRGGEVFTFLAGHVAEAVRLQPPGKRYRILSVPCSTGEEPYSLVIALAEVGVLSAAWVVDGIDLNLRHIERAQQGRFSDFSFRQTAPELRQRYFQAVKGGWDLDPAIRSRARFRQGNLLAPSFLGGEQPFDLVFCRNLFIYLNPAARRRALDALDRLLAPQGLLCTGHAEPLDQLDPRFEHAGSQGYFLYRRSLDGQGDKETRRQGDKENMPRAAPARGLVVPSQEEPIRSPVSLSAVSTPVPVDLLAQARQQANEGQHDEAFSTCQAQLVQAGPSADLFSLMGVLHQARQEKDAAVRCFQRALYLEPGHADALTHLMLLCQEQGDQVQAARLRRRLKRIAPGGEA